LKERLQKHLARAGLGSRRYCETLIEQGRVSVNGTLVERVGFQVDPAADRIVVDGEPIEREAASYYLLHKPKGFVCSNRPQGNSRSVIDLVRGKKGERLFSVGRLDEQSHGALILTNDGEFSNRVIHPRYGVEKTYLVSVKGKPDPLMLDKIRRGIHLAEGKTAPATVHVVKRSRTHSLVKVTIHEGKNRHLRRIFARIGLPVTEILRIQIGSLALGRLKPGQYRTLSPGEVEALLDESRVGRTRTTDAVDSDPNAPADGENAESGGEERTIAPRPRPAPRSGPRFGGGPGSRPNKNGTRPHHGRHKPVKSRGADSHRGRDARFGRPTKGPRPDNHRGGRRSAGGERTNYPGDDGAPFDAFDPESEE
jgi:23S rRNA pseudouridine2605 synthase